MARDSNDNVTAKEDADDVDGGDSNNNNDTARVVPLATTDDTFEIILQFSGLQRDKLPALLALYQKGPIIHALKEAAQQRGKTTEKLFDEPAYKQLLRGDPDKRFSAADIPGTKQQILVKSKTGHMVVKVELLPQVSFAVSLCFMHTR